VTSGGGVARSLPECQQFAEHLAGCNPCQVVDNIRRTISLYKAVEPDAIRPEFQACLQQTLHESWKDKFPPTSR
jgi:hypothetical protein